MNVETSQRIAVEGVQRGDLIRVAGVACVVEDVQPSGRDREALLVGRAALFLQEPEMSHTPGPWRVIRTVAPHLVGVQMGQDGGFSVEGNNAAENARLIAAAPELLDALKSTLDLWGPAGFDECADAHCTCVQQQARAAINKAEGHNHD